MLPLAGQVQGKREYVERGCVWNDASKAFQPSTANREGRDGESKEVVARTMSPFVWTVPASSQIHWTPGPQHYLAPLRRRLAGWPSMVNAAASEISLDKPSWIRRTAHNGDLTAPHTGRG